MITTIPAKAFGAIAPLTPPLVAREVGTGGALAQNPGWTSGAVAATSAAVVVNTTDGEFGWDSSGRLIFWSSSSTGTNWAICRRELDGTLTRLVDSLAASSYSSRSLAVGGGKIWIAKGGQSQQIVSYPEAGGSETVEVGSGSFGPTGLAFGTTTPAASAALQAIRRLRWADDTLYWLSANGANLMAIFKLEGSNIRHVLGSASAGAEPTAGVTTATNFRIPIGGAFSVIQAFAVSDSGDTVGVHCRSTAPFFLKIETGNPSAICSSVSSDAAIVTPGGIGWTSEGWFLSGPAQGGPVIVQAHLTTGATLNTIGVRPATDVAVATTGTPYATLGSETGRAFAVGPDGRLWWNSAGLDQSLAQIVSLPLDYGTPAATPPYPADVYNLGLNEVAVASLPIPPGAKTGEIVLRAHPSDSGVALVACGEGGSSNRAIGTAHPITVPLGTTHLPLQVKYLAGGASLRLFSAEVHWS